MKLKEFIVKFGHEHLLPVNELKTGHNGPYLDPETPVRNVSHCLVTASRIYTVSKQELLLQRVKEYADYLASPAARPEGFNFDHRHKKGKDRCNGLIGPAWTFEALAEASGILQDDSYVNLGREVFNQHVFNEKYGLWYRLEVDGETLPLDKTFNHQLWFAAAAAQLCDDTTAIIHDRINRFIDEIPRNLEVLNNGLLFHPIVRVTLDELLAFPPLLQMPRKSAKVVKTALERAYVRMPAFRQKRLKAHEVYRSAGYHAFNMYAFAMLKNSYPEHPFWGTGIFGKLLGYVTSDEFKQDIEGNAYGFPYNPAGFEMPYILETFLEDREYIIKESQYWLNRQFQLHYNEETGMFDRDNPDPVVLTARIYELCRISDWLMDELVVL